MLSRDNYNLAMSEVMRADILINTCSRVVTETSVASSLLLIVVVRVSFGDRSVNLQKLGRL